MQNSITIIADASWCHITKAAGYGVWLACTHGRKGFEGPLNEPQDNNVAEAMAIVNGVWHGLNSGLLQPHTNVLIQTDSDTAIQIFKGLKQAYNVQMDTALAYLKDVSKRYDLLIRFKHIPGHTAGEDKRTRAQNHCDTAALRQMRKQREAKCVDSPILANKLIASGMNSKKSSFQKDIING